MSDLSRSEAIDGDVHGPRPDESEVDQELQDLAAESAAAMLHRLADLLGSGKAPPARVLRLAATHARCQLHFVTALAVPDLKDDEVHERDERDEDFGDDDIGRGLPLRTELQRRFGHAAAPAGALFQRAVEQQLSHEAGDAIAMQRLHGHLAALREARQLGDQPELVRSLEQGLSTLLSHGGGALAVAPEPPNPHEEDPS